MYKNIIANVLAIALIGVIEVCLFGSLPFGLWRLHLLPLLLIFIFLFTNIRVAAWWALGGGLVLELFSFYHFGTYIVLLWLVLAIIYFLFEKVMTDRSVFSVVTVAAVITLVCDLFRLLLDYNAAQVTAPFSSLLERLVLSLVVNVVAAIIIFYISNLASRRLRPVFLTINRL
jgi:cell shape-determining protein MreD